MCIVGASAMVRREALLDCRGYRDVPTPDFDLARRFVEHYRIAALSSRLYAYVQAQMSGQSMRYRQTARLLLRHQREYGSSARTPRLLWRVAWNTMMGTLPFAPQTVRYAREVRRKADVVALPGYESWLRRLDQLNQHVGQESPRSPLVMVPGDDASDAR